MGFLTRTLLAKTIADVTLEDLEREQNRLRADQDKLHAEADAIDLRERQLLDEGRAAANAAMQRRIAGKIKEVRDRRKTVDQRLSVVVKALRVAIGLYTIKENEAFYKSAGLGGALSGIPLAQIIAYIEKAPAGVEQTVDGMRDILESLGKTGATLDETFADPGADGELDDIMSEFADAPPAEEPTRVKTECRATDGASPESIPTNEPKREEK